MLVVLKGGSEFATDLTRSLRKRHTYSGSTHLPFTVDYIRVKSYEGTESTGNGAGSASHTTQTGRACESLGTSGALHGHRLHRRSETEDPLRDVYVAA